MKLKHIVLLSMTLMSVANSYGQTWTGTTTTGNVGIGTSTLPSDKLYIYNPTYTHGYEDLTVPAIRIDRERHVNFMPGIANIDPNIFEVWFDDASAVGATSHLVEVIDPQGNFGINLATPTARLDVNGDAVVRNNLNVNVNATVQGTLAVQGNLIDMNGVGGADGVRNIFGNTTASWLGICSGSGGGTGADGAYVQLFATGSGVPGSAFIATTGPSTSGTSFITQPSGNTNMMVRNDGKVIIGNDILDNTPDGYNLYVSTGILTEKLKVATVGGGYWADFVFNKNYQLKSLGQVEAYINANKHLPDVPSASEVEKDGIDVVNMDAKLLQKIEELTLYVIQQQKQLEQQSSEIEMLKKSVNK